ncbi:hypothetical protein [Parathalassolituus penaei]|uniref:Uncharacterized protein n=1 Tax=Parathalassolituus penaei TaxID=2997323 RepID=A0A9X3ISX3_9GAMM|nr:hypothetical protein [Parathalassolituus penaei]MCY0965334.1 hypothetical protein [Parathalassolituus penaei]
MSSKNNVIDFQRPKDTSSNSSTTEEPKNEGVKQDAGKNVKLSEQLRSTIDDGLKQQMREQMRKKHELKKQK